MVKRFKIMSRFELGIGTGTVESAVECQTFGSVLEHDYASDT